MSELLPEVPRALDELVQRALSKSSVDRPRDALAMRRALERAVPAELASSISRTGRHRRAAAVLETPRDVGVRAAAAPRSKARLTTYLVACLLVLAATGAWIWHVRSGARASPTDPAAIFHATLKSAEAGDRDALFKVAMCYRDGQGVAMDLKYSAGWLRRAADAGHTQAAYALGMALRNGTGVDKDLVQSLTWFRKAADQGHVDAASAVGDAYERGLGVSRDRAQGLEWHRKAAEGGSAAGQKEPGGCYQDGCCVPRNLATAAGGRSASRSFTASQAGAPRPRPAAERAA